MTPKVIIAGVVLGGAVLFVVLDLIGVFAATVLIALILIGALAVAVLLPPA